MAVLPKLVHRWDLYPQEAVALQHELAAKVIIAPCGGPLRTIAAADVAFRGEDAVAAVCVFNYPELELLETRCARVPCPMPYIPGLLTFREGPALIEAFGKLSHTPDLILFDGQGIAHPRKMGIASHMGVIFDIPAIGCAKSRLVGQPERELPQEKGSRVKLLDKDGDELGVVLRSRGNVKPLYVSPGHRVSMEQAVEIVLSCCGKYRIPEPLRHADRLSKHPE
jgi:deoxyribonuclease V